MNFSKFKIKNFVLFVPASCLSWRKKIQLFHEVSQRRHKGHKENTIKIDYNAYLGVLIKPLWLLCLLCALSG